MAQLKRSEIIAEARIEAGRQSESITLTKEYDWIIQDMAKRANLLAEVATGNITADQNYIALPPLFKEVRLLDVGGRYKRRYSSWKVGDNWLRRLLTPSDFYYLDQTQYGDPTLYMIEKSPSIYKAYLYPKTETDTPAYSFYYWKYHEKAWKTWSGLAAKTDISFTQATSTIASAAAEFDTEACAAGRKLTVAGSASNNGTYTIVSATSAAVVVSEALTDEAAGASVTITVESEDNYLHLYGENWDHVVIMGVGWQAAKRIKEWKIAETLWGIYDEKLADMARDINRSPGARTQYHHF